MNLVGKILIVLIFVMSLMWMTVSMMVYATHRNWRDEIERKQPAGGRPAGREARLTALRAEKDNLTKEKDDLNLQLESEQAARRQVLAKLKTEKLALSTENEQIKGEYEKLRDSERTSVAALEVSQRNNATLQSEVERLRDEIRTANAQRDEAFQQLVAAEDDLHQKQGTMNRMDERQKQLVEQVARAKTVLEKLGYSLQTPPDFKPPMVDGVVLAISSAGGGDELVEISIGADDGLIVGNDLEVFRDKTYLGRIKVLQTSPDRAVGRIDKKLQSGPIQKGDRVATRFKA